MAELYPYEKRNHYPHMMPADVAIWERFIAKFPNAYNSVEYDVKVGTIPEFVAQHPDTAIQGEANLYARKIDVVGHSGPNIDIIELKPLAGLSAIGQVKGYIELYKRDLKPATEPRGVVITDRILLDIEYFAKKENIRIIAV